MGFMTAEEMKSEISMNLAGNTVAPDRLQLWLNFALYNLASYQYFEELEKSAAFVVKLPNGRRTTRRSPAWSLPRPVRPAGSCCGLPTLRTVSYLSAPSVKSATMCAAPLPRPNSDRPAPAPLTHSPLGLLERGY